MISNKKLNDFLPDKNSSYFKSFDIDNIESIKQVAKDEIIACLKTVMDPEIPVNLYDLGLIYKIEIDDNNNVKIEMTLTNPNCPVAGVIPENLGKSVDEVKGIRSIQVKLVWEPKWHKEFMSEDAKLALDIF